MILDGFIIIGSKSNGSEKAVKGEIFFASCWLNVDQNPKSDTLYSCKIEYLVCQY